MDEVAVFERDVGTWDAEIEAFQPGGVQKSRGVMTSRLLGGRWLVADFKNETGFEGHGIYGYDPEAKSYVGTWVDSMRGFLVTGRGQWDAEKRTMTFRYQHTAGGKPMAWREETTVNPDGTQTFRVVMAGPDGNDFTMMTVLYRRQTIAAPR